MFINVHVHTEDKYENEKDKFYSLLDNTLSDISRGDTQIILSYVNSKIRRRECY